MRVKIENLTNRPVLLRLNSGQSLHLAPRITSTEIMGVEVSNNAKVEKLEGRCVVALHEVKKLLGLKRVRQKKQIRKRNHNFERRAVKWQFYLIQVYMWKKFRVVFGQSKQQVRLQLHL